ncbi:MAG: hypothetical protein IJ491_09755 [Clostridia bacterium]|nr:hypothetical protein [Clostridia bacterium]
MSNDVLKRIDNLPSTRRIKSISSRGNGDEDDKILKRIGMLESTKRVTAIREQYDTLESKKQQQKEFMESDENVGFWESLAPGGATPSDWKEGRKKKKQYQNEVDEAAVQVAAYEQFLEEKKFQDKVNGMTADDIDKLLDNYDKEIADYENEKIGFLEAMKPGGVTPSERKEINSAMNSQINALESEQGKYRAVRDEKKSREMTAELPEDVVKLLDEYNSLATANEGIDLGNMFTPASQKSHAHINMQKLEVQKQQLAIAEELKKRGYENYEELAEYRKYITDKEETQEYEAEMEEFTEEHPVISSVGNLGLMHTRTIMGARGNLSALDNKTDLGINPYSPYYGLTRGNSVKKQTIENSFEDGIISADVKKFLYNTAESGVESLLAATTMGGAGGLILGTGAMNETVIETIEKGGTAEQALVSGVAAGAFEMLFESVSIGQFNALKEVSATTIKDAVLNVVKSTGVNFTEEAATEIANIAFDYWYNGGNSDYYEAVVSLMEQGYNENEAKQIANKQMAWQVTQAGLGGALMGGVFGAVGSAQSAAGYNSAMLEEGRRLTQEGKVERELAAASELGVNKDDSIYKFLQEAEAYQRQKNDNDTFEGTKKQLKSIGKLSEGLNQFTSQKIDSASVSSIENRLTELGETENTVDIAKIIQKVVNNRATDNTEKMSKLTRAERKILANNPSAQRVLSEITGSKYFKSDGWNVARTEAIDKVINSRKSPDIEAYRRGNVSEKAAESEAQETEDKTPYGFESYENKVKETVINEGQDRERFESNFELFKAYGEAGRSFEEVKQNSTVSDDFTEVQMKAAFDLGKEKAEAQKITVLKGIQRVEDGEVYVTDTKDNVSKLSEVNTDGVTLRLYKSAAKYDTDTANVFVQGFNRSASVNSYRTAFKAFYSAGAASADITFDDAMKKNGALVKYMTDKDVAKKAFEQGRKERIKADKATVQKKQTGKFPSKGAYQNKSAAIDEDGVDEFYSALSQKLGIDIERVHSLRNSEGRTANAQYSANKNKMTVSATADNEWQGSIHELVHGAFAYNTEKMKAVKKAVIDWFISQHGETEFENALEKYKVSYEGLTRAELEEEFTADAIGGMFSTEEGVQDFLNWLQEESGYDVDEKKKILQRFAEWLNDIIEAIRDIMNSGELNGAGKLFAKENCDELTKIRKMFLETLDGYGEKYRTGGAVEGDIKNEIKVDIDGNKFVEVEEKLFDVQNGESHAKTIARIIKDRFNNLISVNGQQIQINAITNREWRRSESASYLSKTAPDLYDDKLKTIPHADEIIRTAKNWIGEELSHPRKDDIIEFARGTVYYKVNSNGYVADVLVGIRKNGVAVLYDLKNIYQKNITDASLAMESKNSQRSEDTSVDNSISNSTENVKYSFAGIKARTHDLKSLNQADRLEDVGKASSEEIRQQTGWFRGYDGKWRYEISDRDMEMIENPKLERVDGDVTYFTGKVGDILKHDKLFEAYPEIKDVNIIIQPTEIGVEGTYQPKSNYITLNIKLFERYTKEYSDFVFSRGEEAKKIEQTPEYKEYNKWYTDKKLLDMDPEKWIEQEQKAEKKFYSSELGKRYYKLKWGKYDAEKFEFGWSKQAKNVLLHELQHVIQHIEGFARGASTTNPNYDRVAGEVEARDTASRWWRTDEARKEKRPDIDRTDVVFSDGGVSNDIKIDTKGNKFVEVDEKLFNPRKGESHASTIARIIKDKFNNLITVNGQKIQINKDTNREWRFSGAARKLLQGNPVAYDDKLKTIPNADEILKAAKKWVGEEKYHSKNPDIVEFARGNVLYRVGNNGYIADVIVGIKKNNSAVLYDLVNIQGKKITEAPVTMASINPQRRQNASVTNNVTHSVENVKNSLKHSLDWVDWDDYSTERTKSLAKKVTELEKINEDLRLQIRHPGQRHIVSLLETQRVMRELVSGYMSKVDRKKVTAELYDLYTLIANDITPSWDVIDAHLEDIADMILNESKYLNPDRSEESKSILRDMKSVKIKLSDSQKTEVASSYGSYNEFRKKTMGTLILSNEGIDLDIRWKELCESYPQYFSEDVAEPDQPATLMEIAGILRNTYEDDNGFDYDSAKDFLKTEIYEKYFEVPETKLLSQEYQAKLAKAKVEYSERLKEAKADFRQQRDEVLKTARNEYDAKLKMTRSEWHNTKIREKKRNRLIKTVKRLDRLLRKPDRAAPSAGINKYGQEYVHLTNIPEDFKKAVIDFCSVFIDNDAGVFTGNIRDGIVILDKKINEMQKQYANLKRSKSYMSTVVNEDMEKNILKAAEIMGAKKLAQLSVSELDTLNEIADHLIAVINNEVVMWVNGKKTKVDDTGKATLDELNSKGMKGYRKAMQGIDKLDVMNLKPIYFFEKVGGTLEKLWNDILGGQDRYVRNMQYAQQRFSDIAKKHHLDSWIDDEAETFTTSQGHEISLTRGQALLVWATWKREGVADKESKHLFQGGIVFPDAVAKASDKGKNKLPKVLQTVYEDGTAHRIRIEDMVKIDAWLTKEQKAYADELVAFLSNDVASWGNEISMQLYGINKFNEKYYIPFNSAGNYLYKGMGDEGTKLLKSEEFTKETQWGANNPLVVDDITQVVVKHIERMSMYNSMVMPLDNFSRVWNYQKNVDADSNDSQQNVKAAFETAWGKEYAKYVNDLLRDINGGVMSDSREIGSEWISKFKKAAVMGSASVMIQQPSAIVRAFSEVDTKYFVATTFKQRKAAYEEAKQYAPIALLKEIGGFDTVGGQSMTDWMLKREYKGKDKLVAFFKDSQFRDDVISWGPAFADRITWAHIWLACKKEVQHEKGFTGEILLEATGKRFTEVINKTQVYDSVLSRSGAMRSQSTLMKMQTAFMAEPTTQWNMYGSAVRDWKKGNRKKAIRKVSAIVGAQIFNSILVSIIYASRDDDEDKSLIEKYIGEVVGNFFDSLNPLTLVPFVKDIISLMQGYDVERSDMSVFANVIDAFKDLGNNNMSGLEKTLGLAGSGLDAFGVPFENLIRDGKAFVNTAKSFSNGPQTTSGGILASIRDEMFPILKNFNIISDKKGELLYDAFVNENTSLYAEYASRYKDGSTVKSTLTGQIKDRYLEGDITEAEATELLGKLGYSENDAYYKLRDWNTPKAEMEATEDENAAYFTLEGMEGLSASKDDADVKVSYTFLHDAIEKRDTVLIKSEIEDLISHGAEEESIKRSVSSKWGKAYRESTSSVERKEIEQMIAATGLWKTGEVFAMTRRWRRKAEDDTE